MLNVAWSFCRVSCSVKVVILSGKSQKLEFNVEGECSPTRFHFPVQGHHAIGTDHDI